MVHHVPTDVVKVIIDELERDKLGVYASAITDLLLERDALEARVKELESDLRVQKANQT